MTPAPTPRPTLPPAVRARKMLGTVRKLAAQLARRLPSHVDLDDLVGAGSLGLADALKRRGAMTGTEFDAFATFRIRGAMLDELRRLDAVPRRSRRRANEIARAHRAVEQRTGAGADDEAVAKELGIELASLHALRARIDACRAPISIAGVTDEGEDATMDVPDAKSEGPDALVARSEIGARVLAAFDQLPERMRFVLRSIYVEGATLKDIGHTLGVSESRACQIHGEALTGLRAILGRTEEEAPPVSGVRVRAAVGPAVQARRVARRWSQS